MEQQQTRILRRLPKNEPTHNDDGHKEESPKGNKETRQDIDPKETPQDQKAKHNDDGHKGGVA